MANTLQKYKTQSNMTGLKSKVSLDTGEYEVELFPISGSKPIYTKIDKEGLHPVLFNSLALNQEKDIFMRFFLKTLFPLVSVHKGLIPFINIHMKNIHSSLSN